MTPNKYQELAMRTAGSLHSGTHGLLITALGLSGEAGELCGVMLAGEVLRRGGQLTETRPSIDELGDLYWYVARGATAIHTMLGLIELNTVTDHEYLLEQGYPDATTRVLRLVVLTGGFAEQVKKHVYHSHEWEYDRAQRMLARILACCDLLCIEAGTTRQDVWEANITKLKARYPEGFDAERSRTRSEYAREQMD